jgi:hypothetical protein
VEDAINKIPTQKLNLMDNNNLTMEIPSRFFIDFENDIYNALGSDWNKSGNTKS